MTIGQNALNLGLIRKRLSDEGKAMTTHSLRHMMFTALGVAAVATAQQVSTPKQHTITPISNREVKIEGIGRFKLTGVRRIGPQVETWNPDGTPTKLDNQSETTATGNPTLEFICEAEVTNPDLLRKSIRVRMPGAEPSGRLKSFKPIKTDRDKQTFEVTFTSSIKPGAGNSSFSFAMPTDRFETVASCDFEKGTTWTADPKHRFEVGRDKPTKVSGEAATDFDRWSLRWFLSTSASGCELWVQKKDGTEVRLPGYQGSATDDGWLYLSRVENCAWDDAARFELRKPLSVLVKFENVALSPREVGK